VTAGNATATLLNPPLLPGGYGRANIVVGERAPLVRIGSGCKIVDEYGDEKIDLNNNFTALLHGHAHSLITDRATGALQAGASFGLPNEWELKHARALIDRIPWAEQVRYTNSGTEAVMTAIRVARAATGRDKVVIQRPAYHGTSSTVLPALSDAARRGVPAAVEQQLVVIETGNCEALDRAFAKHPDEMAAVLLDLMPTRSGLVPVSPEFLRRARALASDAGAYLVIDEVISYRLALGGLSAAYEVEPDLLVLGKLIGGGLPIGAIVGTEEMMRVLNPLLPGAIPHGGTFSANPVSMAAGTAALELATETEINRINSLGDHMRRFLRPIAERRGWTTSGYGSLLSVRPSDGAPDRMLRLWWAAYERGLLITPGTGLLCISTAMDETVIDEAGILLGRALEAV
jgi:glutamate-1-semialdehyde 2,1-aminomutase